MARKKKIDNQEIEDEKTTPPKKAARASEPEPVEATEESGVAKIQCLNRRRKLICSHLLLDVHKCSVKSIAPGRLASVRIGKKRRCALYEESPMGGKSS